MTDLPALPAPRSIYQFATADFLTHITTGDEHSWDEEERRLLLFHQNRLARIERELATGPFWPVAVCLRERRVIDGHHRVVCARRMRLPQILAVDAWTDNVWLEHITTSGADA